MTLVFGHGLDTWSCFDPLPVRFIAVLAGVVAVWAGPGYAPDSPWLAVPDAPANASTAAQAPWVTADQWPHPGGGPVVVVAAPETGSPLARPPWRADTPPGALSGDRFGEQ